MKKSDNPYINYKLKYKYILFYKAKKKIYNYISSYMCVFFNKYLFF